MRLGVRTKAAYGLGAVAQGIAVAGLSGALLQIFLNQALGLPALAVGTMIMASLMVDAVADPLIGAWSDRTKSRWGRRHPFMYAAAVPVALTFWLLWNPPRTLSAGGLVVFALVFMIAVRVAVSFYDIPSNALTPELTPNYDERTTLQSWRWFFGIIAGGLLPLLLTQVYLARRGGHGILDRAAYGDWAEVAAAVMFVSILVSALGTHDRIGALPAAHAGPEPASGGGGWREIARTLGNRSLIALLLGGVLGGVGGGLRNGLSIYLYSYFWGLTPRQFGIILPLSGIGSIVAVFLAPPLARRFGKRNAAIGLFLVSVVLFTAPMALRLVGWFPANGSPFLMPLLILDGAVTATVGVVGFILFGAMVADVVEDAAVKTGARSAGLLYSVNGLLQKFTGGIGAFLAGALLTLVRFPVHAAAASVDPGLMRRLVIWYLPINAVFSIASILVLALYRIDRRTHEANLATLADAAAMAGEARGIEAAEGGQALGPVTPL